MNFAQCHEISCFFLDGVPYVRFHEFVDRFPTVRMLMLIPIIKLQKLISAKRRVNKRTCGLVDIIKLLRIEMNWD